MFSVNVHPIKAIIFDVGGVFNEGKSDFTETFRAHGIELKEDLWANARCKAFIVKFCTGGYGQGEDSAKEFVREICAEEPIGREISFELFKAAWNTLIVKLHHELIDQLKVLRQQGFRLFILSDTNMLHRNYLEELYQIDHPDQSFRNLFDRCYFSHETGNYKAFPDQKANQAWLQILQDNRLEPWECLFIDDKSDYVDKARRLGIHGLHYPAGSTSSLVFRELQQLQTEAVRISPRIFEHVSHDDLKKLRKMLGVFQIPSALVDQSEIPSSPPSSLPEVIDTKNSHTMREHKGVGIYLIRSDNFYPYFLIKPKDHETPNDTLISLQLHKLIRFLKERGYAQYVLYQNHGDRSLKIIPVLENDTEVDINQKIINAIFCFFGMQALRYFNLQGFRMKGWHSSFPLQSLRLPQQAKWINLSSLAHNVNNAIFQHLSSQGALSAPPASLQKLKKAIDALPREVTRDMSSCAFCQENIIRSQLVFDLGRFLLLVNSRPFSGTKAHFLLVPRHIEDWSDLNAEEKDNLILLLKSLVYAIQANCGVQSTEVISYVQNGVQAGQTVRHSHMHVMTSPEWIPYSIDIAHQMAGQTTPILDRADVQRFSTSFLPIFYQKLLSNATPPRLLRFDEEKVLYRDKALSLYQLHLKRSANTVSSVQAIPEPQNKALTY